MSTTQYRTQKLQQGQTWKISMMPTHDLGDQVVQQWEEIKNELSDENVQAFEPVLTALVSRSVGFFEIASQGSKAYSPQGSSR